jgi:hypothetical protein
LTLKDCVELSGWAAALLVLGSYCLLSFGKIVAWNGAWPSVALNVVWLGIATYALRRNTRLKVQ